MAKRSGIYKSEKRKKELSRSKKQEEKRKKRLEKNSANQENSASDSLTHPDDEKITAT